MCDVNSLICSFVPDSVWQIPFDFFKWQFIYFFRHERLASDLKKQIKHLNGIVDTMKRKVEAATANGEVVYENVREWLASVDGVISEEKAKELESARERAKARCFVGLCPNLWSRRQLCKMAIAEAATVASFLKDYPHAPMFHGTVACRPALKGMIGDALDEDNMNFESRANTFEGIIKALRDPSVPRVGVYGMGGVGKTTLVKQIQRKAREENIFVEIALATVTIKPNTKRIQGEIADALGLKLTAETVAGRATELSHRLINGKSILIILDDIWEELSMSDIGISFKDCQPVDGNKMPMEDRAENIKVPRSKILMTSRSQDVLCVMKSASNFEVALLPLPDAKSLFTKTIGGVPRGDDYESIAIEVIEECAGSPIAIAAIAKALRTTTNMDVWQDARNNLKSSMANRSMEGVQQHIYATLKLSYEMLKDKEAQQLFLLLSMYAKRDNIFAEDLLSYGEGLGIFDDVGTCHEARIRLNALLHKLRASSLLLKGDYNNAVKLHDLFRELAANIAKSDPHNMFCIKGNSDFKRLSDKGKLSLAAGISFLLGSDGYELPDILECPKLEFLFMWNETSSFMTIPDHLFQQTKELKVLDMTGMKELKSLPASLLSLTCLQTLCVDWCSGKIRNISIIGKLQQLLVLRIRGSDIEELPEDLKQLRELQLLDLSSCSKLKVIPENLFSSLTKLEELYMGDSFNRWGVEGNASVSELLNLSSLKVLHIHIPQAEMIPEGMPFEKLTAYYIVIGGTAWYWDCNYEKSKKLMIFNPGVSIRLNPDAKKLLASTEELRLHGLKGFRNVLYEFSNAKAFPDLESLTIMYSDDLEVVCHGQPKPEALMGLRSLKISFCYALTRLFPLSMAKHLLQLEKIEVSYCENLITIFDMAMVDSNEACETTVGIELSKLRSLTLTKLPKFVGFCTQDQQIQPLFNERVKYQQIQPLFNLFLPLPHMLGTMSHGLVNLTSLTSLIIDKCGHLKYVFSFSVVRTLKQLQRLEVSGCESMEMIVFGEETNPGNEFGAKLSFPQLKFLKLECMKNLIGFCSKNYDVDFPFLESLGVSGCYLLEALFSMNDTNLRPYFSDKMLLPHTPDTMLFGMPHGLTSLTTLEISELSWNYLFSVSVVRAIEQFQELNVSSCQNMEVIVLGEETNPGNELSVKLSFPRLNKLTLQNMGRLRQFCSKNYNVDFPVLEWLEVRECCQLEALFSPHDVDLQPHFNDKIPLLHTLDAMPSRMSHGLVNLTSLTIDKCGHLKYLFSFSVARTLKKLQLLEVRHCKSMEMIVLGAETNPGSELGVNLSFPQLNKLRLCHMERLRRFCSKNYNVDFPSLEWLEVHECYQLEALSSTHNVDLQPHFNDKILLPHTLDTMLFGLTSLTTLKISELSWNYLFSVSVVRALEQLRELNVSSCQNMEVIVLGEETNPDNELAVKLSFPRLNGLMLKNMGRLRRFCSKNYNVDFPSFEWLEVHECHQLEAFSSMHDVDLQPLFNDKAYFTQILNRNLEDITQFQCLKHLDFTSCDSLKYLFNHSMAFNLVLLESLYVGSCKMMKEIVTEEITAPNQNETVIFPCLKTLYVRDCPNLINFCAGKQSLKFPSLEQLTLRKCPNVLSFYSTSTEGEVGPSNCTSPSFCSDKVGLPSLSRLVMEDFDNVVTIFSSNIVHRFLGIQKLEIINCAALEMVYEMQGLSTKEHSANGVAQLRELTIKDLPKLRCIWSEDPQGVAFQNLSKVFAWGCENLKYLFPPSVAQGLSQLKKLKICHCGVEEVVAVDNDEQQVMRFAFPQLRKFILLALPKLKFFYAGQHTIEWPKLEFVLSDDIEGLSKVLPNTPMQLIERDTGLLDSDTSDSDTVL